MSGRVQILVCNVPCNASLCFCCRWIEQNVQWSLCQPFCSKTGFHGSLHRFILGVGIGSFVAVFNPFLMQVFTSIVAPNHPHSNGGPGKQTQETQLVHFMASRVRCMLLDLAFGLETRLTWPTSKFHPRLMYHPWLCQEVRGGGFTGHNQAL